MLFSAIIPTYDNLAELQGCLTALDRIGRDDLEVHVCVDGSRDGSSEWLEKAAFSFDLRVHHHPGRVNRGRSATRNLALPHLRGRYVLFMDSDMQAAPDLFEKHLEILAGGNSVSIGSVRYHNRAQNLWVRYTSERGVAKYPSGSEVPFHYFITPNTALPTAWLQETQGFDEKINRYGGEDMELGYRLQQRGQIKFIYNGDAKVYTTQPKTLAEALPQLKEYGGTGLPYIREKWPELGQIYWIHCVESRRLKDRLFEFLTRGPFRGLALGLLRITPFTIQKQLINYLVISYVHWGYRGALKKKKTT